MKTEDLISVTKISTDHFDVNEPEGTVTCHACDQYLTVIRKGYCLYVSKDWVMRHRWGCPDVSIYE